MATATPGISAVQLQLGISRYETAWMMLHKLRRAMVDPEREHLTDQVDVDECFVGGLDRELRGGRQHGTKALMAGAVEVRGAGSGRVRMHIVENASTATLCGLVTEVGAEGSVVPTDGWNAYRLLSKLGFDHRPRTQRLGRVAVEDLDEILPRVHRVICNLKTWLQGTHRGVSKETSSSTSTSTSFASTDGARPWRPSRPCLVWADNSYRPPTARSTQTARAC